MEKLVRDGIEDIMKSGSLPGRPISKEYPRTKSFLICNHFRPKYSFTLGSIVALAFFPNS